MNEMYLTILLELSFDPTSVYKPDIASCLLDFFSSISAYTPGSLGKIASEKHEEKLGFVLMFLPLFKGLYEVNPDKK